MLEVTRVRSTVQHCRNPVMSPLTNHLNIDLINVHRRGEEKIVLYLHQEISTFLLNELMYLIG